MSAAAGAVVVTVAVAGLASDWSPSLTRTMRYWKVPAARSLSARTTCVPVVVASSSVAASVATVAKVPTVEPVTGARWKSTWSTSPVTVAVTVTSLLFAPVPTLTAGAAAGVAGFVSLSSKVLATAAVVE